jgi:hypothetical protein
MHQTLADADQPACWPVGIAVDPQLTCRHYSSGTEHYTSACINDDPPACCHHCPADPAYRITIDQIYHHPWYVKNLPPGVLEMNSQPQPAPEGIQVGL